MPASPTLTDGLVTLRAHRADDVPGVCEQSRDPLFQQWTTVPSPYETAHAEQYVSEVMPRGWADDTEWGFAVEVDGRYAGSVSLRARGERRAEIAFGAHPWVRGTGQVERALRLLLDWGFAERDLQLVVWWANRGNWASRRLAWRLGFSFDGTVRSWLPQRGELLDGWVGTLLAGEPLAPRTAWLDCPVLDAGRAVLRPWQVGDTDRIVEACSDDRTQHWLGRLPSPYTRADATAYLEDRLEVRASGSAVGWAVADPETDLLWGSVELSGLRPDVASAEVGYWTHPDARGRGVMTSAVAAAVRHAFGPLGLNRVTAFTAVGNTGSRRVLEVNGFRLVGVERQAVRIRSGLADHAAYELLAEDLAARAPRSWTAAETSSTANPATESTAPTTAVDR